MDYMRTTYLFNPFKYIAGTKALLTGWMVMLATAYIAWRGNTRFDGVIDAHFGLVSSFGRYILDALTDWASAVVFFHLAALRFSGSSVRFIDTAGTMALARAPMLPAALLSWVIDPVKPILPIKDVHDISSSFLVAGLGMALCSCWMIALMYHAFKVSSNLKGSKGAWIFIAALIAAEIVSKILFAFLIH